VHGGSGTSTISTAELLLYIAYIEILESARSQADLHSLSTPDQSVKFVFVRTGSSLIITVVLILESSNERLGIIAKRTR